MSASTSNTTNDDLSDTEEMTESDNSSGSAAPLRKRRRIRRWQLLLTDDSDSSSSYTSEGEPAHSRTNNNNNGPQLRRRAINYAGQDSSSLSSLSSANSDLSILSTDEDGGSSIVTVEDNDGSVVEFTPVNSDQDAAHSDSSYFSSDENVGENNAHSSDSDVTVSNHSGAATSALSRSSQRPTAISNSPASVPAVSGSPAKATVVKPNTSNGASSNPTTSANDTLDSDEGQCCPICFDSWSNAGEHRIVALKCGHLFGKVCIEKWLKGQGSKCPQCNTKNSKKDMINIYASNVKVQDTAEKERLVHEIESMKQQRSNEEKEKAQLLMKMAVDSQLIKQLQKEVQMLKYAKGEQSGSDGSQNIEVSPAAKLSPFQTFDLSKDGGCRVMAFSQWMNLLVVSLPSSLSMFPGYGVKKFNTLTLKVEKYLPLHSKQIRDADFNPSKRDLLLSVSLDKVAKITNMSSDATVISYTTTSPLWCCCWNKDNPSEFFAGTSSGIILHFDTARNTEEPIGSHTISGSGPIVSLTYVPVNFSKDFSSSGLIVTRLTTLSFLEIKNNEFKDHGLPLEGPFTHTSFDPDSRHFLTTCRPTDKNFHARHILCELRLVNISSDPTVVKNIVTANQIHCFEGSTTMKVLSRNTLCTHPRNPDKCIVVISEESTNNIKIYDVATTSLQQSIRLNINVLDSLSMETSQGKCMTFLAEKSISIFKWV